MTNLFFLHPARPLSHLYSLRSFIRSFIFFLRLHLPFPQSLTKPDAHLPFPVPMQFFGYSSQVRWSEKGSNTAGAAAATTPQPPTVVMLHGIMGSKRNLISFAKRLAQAFPAWQFLLVRSLTAPSSPALIARLLCSSAHRTERAPQSRTAALTPQSTHTATRPELLGADSFYLRRRWISAAMARAPRSRRRASTQWTARREMF